MKIIHIISGLSAGGAEAVLYRLCTFDNSEQHHVVSLTDAGKYGPLLEAKGITVSYLNMPRGRISYTGVWRLWRLIKEIEPDVVQTWMYHADLVGGIIARLAGRKNIFWNIRHTELVPGKSTRSTIVVAKICALVSSIIPRRIICCAEKARVVHTNMGYDASRMQIIANGYDLSLFRPDPAASYSLRQQLDIEPDVPVIGFVARFNPQKDHDNLLQALYILKTNGVVPICILVGEGMMPDNAKLMSIITMLGLQMQVRLLGPRSDIPTVMNSLDLHVLSSAFGEAFPNVLAEAMACGTPCVSTDVGDAAAIVGNTGQIVPTNDPEALALGIEALLSERGSSAWSERCMAARTHVEINFSIERMVENYHLQWQA